MRPQLSERGATGLRRLGAAGRQRAVATVTAAWLAALVAMPLGVAAQGQPAAPASASAVNSAISPAIAAATTSASAASPARPSAGPPQSVQVPSLDRDAAGAALQQPGFWWPAADAGRPAPAIVLLHGCGGPYDRQGALSRRMRDYAALLHDAGLAVLVTDSLTPRHERELCTQRLGTRQVTMTQRRRDALGALQWLAAQPGVDASRLGLMGWSNGGSTVLAATGAQRSEVQVAPVKPAFAIAFYPGCADALADGYRPVAPVLLLLGEADDWTPAEPCRLLAAAQPGLGAGAGAGAAPLQWQAYAGAFHGFDGTGPVVLRADVPNGVHPGQGVHVGGNPAARAAALARLQRFLHEQGLAR